LSDSEEEFGSFLWDSKVLQEGALLAGKFLYSLNVFVTNYSPGIDSVTNSYLDNAAKLMIPKWQNTSAYYLRLYYLSGKVEDMPRYCTSLDWCLVSDAHS